MELCSKVENFIEEYMVEDDKGKLKLNVKGSPALVISEYFFKPIIPVVGLEPRYNCEKMSIVFELYRELVSQINTKIGKFIPNKTHFCRFAGITTMTYNNYLKCSDENLQTIMNMIDDYILFVFGFSFYNRLFKKLIIDGHDFSRGHRSGSKRLKKSKRLGNDMIS